MIELKITGNNVHELFTNAAQTFMLLAQGGNTLFAQTAPVESPPLVPEPAPIEAEIIPPKPEKPKRTRAAEVVEAKPLPEGGDPIPDFLDRAKTPTLEECRARTKDIIKKFEDDTYAAMNKPRADATQEDKDAVMTKTMAFMMKVFEPFGIKKAPDLKPAQFVEYLAATAKYL